MPRPKRLDGPEPKRRSRKGCWPCKARKVKCGEEKPSCKNCQRQGEVCDYSIRLNWEGRSKRRATTGLPGFQPSASHFGSVLSLGNVASDFPRSKPGSLAHAETVAGNGASTGNLLLDDMASSSNISQRNLSCLGSSCSTKPQNHIWYENKDSSKVISPPSQLPDPISLSSSPQLLSTVAPSEVVPRYNSSLQRPYDGTSYPSPADTTSSIGSDSVLNTAVRPASQSLLDSRQPVYASSHTPNSPHLEIDDPEIRRQTHHSLPRHCSFTANPNHPAHSNTFTRSAHETEVNASYRPASITSTTPPGQEEDAALSPTNLSVAQEGYFSTVINKPISSGRHSLHYPSGLHTRPPVLIEETDQFASASTAESKWHTYLTTVTDNYGLDCGRPDLDLNRNNDHAAIDVNYALDLISSMWKNQSATPKSVDYEKEPQEHNTDRSRYTYYASPVPINIPRYLSPLPSSLLENPINLMYFHFFLNKTATLLVPHNCGLNPFISVMPSMAIGDPNLLNLTLAYSASHRARYLEHPEPANRIAHWVSNVFPTLRLALEGPHENITDSHLATAIMLLSLKIISPSTFEVPIPWQSHLKLARDLFLARGGLRMARPGNQVGAFLARWLGYLDILGILSCRNNESPVPYTAYHYVETSCRATDSSDEFCIDCFSGFTMRTSVFLARLGQLTLRCDNERFDETGSFRTDWSPSSDVLLEGKILLNDFGDPYERTYIDGEHYCEFEAREILAINRASRCAGLLHLHRRVLGSPLYSPLVTETLNNLIDALNDIKPGGAAEVGLLFPLFTAGCETRDPQQRSDIMSRIVALERTGLKQIQNARRLMQHCWDEDLPWVALAQGEFLG